MKKIGLLIIATNNYINFLQPLIDTTDKYFLTNQDVTYFIFSNKNININTKNNFEIININHEEWPYMTLKRYEFFHLNKELLSSMDFLFYCDVDMMMVNPIGDEILSDLVATQHPGFSGERGTPETNPISTACVFDHEEMQYFAGGFNGGSSQEFLKMSYIISENIKKDLTNNYIAVWHDESHMNKYFINNPPTKILDKNYCYPQYCEMNSNVKLVALVKNHKEVRG